MGSSILDAHGALSTVPIASTAKLITALTVLQTKPLPPGQPGPMLTLSANDVALYNSYKAQGGSVVSVAAGEQISEYQVLQGMMLPSANNLADSLATWAFGSLSAYQTAATTWLAQHDLNQTHVGSDASGFAPSTTSNAHDLVRLGELAMQNPVLAQIVGQATASNIPVAGTIKNINFLLGTAGITGVKTGNSAQAGGVYISSSQITVNNKKVVIVTALVGAPSLWQALNDSLPLIKSAQANFQPVTVLKAGTVVGHYHLPWGGNVAAVASQSLIVNAWGGSTITPTAQLQSISANAQVGHIVGSLAAPASALFDKQSIPIKLQHSIIKPPTWWRLTHP
jgi:D-alanyl-D-alanine carboxypeptidase (penicillin-binding protein 5/6)